MSLYEILAVLALLAAGGYAYSLYRKDLRRTPPGSQDPAAQPAPDQLMFGRERKKPRTDGSRGSETPR